MLPEDLYGIIGWPLAQTMSPLIHNTAFQTLKIPAVYLAWPVEPGQLDRFMDALPIYRIRGLSVTIPHKQAVLSHLDNLTEAAALAGAVNTLFWRDGLLCGDNTDVSGFLAPVAHLPLDHMDMLLLGAGGAAHAAAAGLRMSGAANVRVTSPGNSRQYPLAERFAFTAIPWEERYTHPAELVINATPLGMHGEFENRTPFDFAIAPPCPGGFAYDLVYNPKETLFLSEARKHGRIPIYGIEMFLGQGNDQFRLWLGRDLPEEAKMALQKALGEKK